MSCDTSKIRPLVSVVVPVYNAERYLNRCLDSILNQSYQRVEVVAIDDGSHDHSASILDSYKNRYPDRMIVEHRENGGVAAARNRGIDLARGEFLTFADNDDFLDQDCIEVLMSYALDSEADVVCAGYRRPDPKGNVQVEVVPTAADDWSVYVIGAAWGKLYKTSYIREHGFSFLSTNIGEDLHFTLPVVQCATSLSVVPRAVYNWFFNVESVSSTMHRTSDGLMFEFTLDRIYSKLVSIDLEKTVVSVHYFVRLIAWFLLYTRKGDGPVRSMENCSRYLRWLDSHWPEWRNDPLSTPLRPAGDALPNRVATWIFTRHPRAFKIVLSLYGHMA